MLEIIPSINAPTLVEVQEKIAKVESYVAWNEVFDLLLWDGTMNVL